MVKLFYFEQITGYSYVVWPEFKLSICGLKIGILPSTYYFFRSNIKIKIKIKKHNKIKEKKRSKSSICKNLETWAHELQ